MTRTAEEEARLVAAIVTGLKADLSRTLPDAPAISTLQAGPPNGRFALVSGGRGRVFTTNGGVSTHCDAPTLLSRFATELSDAIAAGVFGPRATWPICPDHDSPLTPCRDGDEVFWICRSAPNGHAVARVGALGDPPTATV